MSFSKDIKRFNDKVERASKMLMRGTAISLFSKVVVRSPVGNTKLWKTKWPPKGYVGGRFRANWNVGINAKPTATTRKTDKSGKAAKGKIKAGVSSYRLGDDIYFINNLPYSQELEDGTSTQAPWGMVKVTVAEFKYIVDKEARRLRAQLFKG